MSGLERWFAVPENHRFSADDRSRTIVLNGGNKPSRRMLGGETVQVAQRLWL